MNPYSELYVFVDSAIKSRKYAENTGYGFRVALKLFESVLNEEEKASIGKVKERLDLIAKSVYAKNNNRFNVDSINAYKIRVSKVISDFQMYGSDPSKMASWSPRRVQRSIKSKVPPAIQVKQESPDTSDVLNPDLKTVVSAPGMQRFERKLRPDIKAIVIFPEDLTTAECKIIKATLDTYVVD